LPERKETAQGFHYEANGDFKTLTEFNGCDRRKLRMESTILQLLHNTNLIYRVKRRKPVQNNNIPKHASFLQQGTKVNTAKTCGKAIHFLS
jgi:hypothetical protein